MRHLPCFSRSRAPILQPVTIVGNGSAVEERKSRIMNAATYSNQKVTPTAAMTPVLVAPTRTRNPAHNETLSEILTRPFRRAKVAGELQQLDERMLSDIGITRSEIQRVAVESVGADESVVASLIKYAARKVARWSQRRDAYRSLMALDDRMLADIGLSRDEIPAVVNAMTGGPIAAALDGSFETEFAIPLKQWNLWRVAHKQLSRLDDRMLDDIGFVRGDIDWVADELATRAVSKTANSNAAAPKAA
jgi:uncharacterized protein YjiS (DUF1127 family)